MTSLQLSLLYIFVTMIYVYFTFQFTAKKIPIIKANKEENLGRGLLKAILLPLMIGFILITSIFVYIGKMNIDNKALPLNNAYTNFYALSENHRTLGTAYRDCSTAILRKTQVSCVREMEDKARYEGISEEFPSIYNDLKTHIFPVEESAQK